MLVRRKRSSHQSTRAVPQDGKLPFKGRGRPMKRPSELAPSQKARRQQAQQIHALLQTEDKHEEPTMSALESLPVEIIQHIFFDSLEVNLPRTSRYMSSILSRPSLYNVLILFAYFDDDGEHPVETRVFRPAEYRCISLDDKLRLQKAILQCRWCTLDRLKSCMPILSRLQMMQCWHNEAITEHSLVPEVTHNPMVPDDRLREVARLPDLDDSEALARHYLARLTDLKRTGRARGTVGPTGSDDFLPWIMRWTSREGEDGRLHKTIDGGLSVLAARVIPDRLIDGTPWTAEKIGYLQLLRQGLRFLRCDHVLVISAKTLFEGMEQAVLEQNSEALTILLELHHATMTSEPTHSLAQSLQGRAQFTYPAAHPIPLRLFHLATKAGPTSSLLMWLLIRAGIDSVPKEDQVLTKWALQNSKWLRDHMDGVDHMANCGLRPGESLFVNGKRSWRANSMHARSMCFSIAEQSFTDEIGYLYEGASGAALTNPDGRPCG